MKKIFLTSIMFLSLFFSCDILEEEPKTVLPPDGYYNTKTGIETLVNACYARLRSFSASTTNLLQLTEQGTDIFEAGRHRAASRGETDSGTKELFWLTHS